jgi:hypothetical protein
MKTQINFVNGAAWLEVNGEHAVPIAYRSFWPQGQTIEAFAQRDFQFYGVFPSGILCSLKVPYSQFGEVWTGEGQYDWANLNAQVDQLIANAPQAKIALMVHLDTRDWYQEQNPGCADTFVRLAQTAGWQKWRLAAARYLRDQLDYLDQHYPERVFAVFLFAGATCEWYTRNPEDGLADNPITARDYQNWYGQDAVLPDHITLHRTTDGCFRHPQQDQAALDFWRWNNEVVADTIAWFALQVKAHTRGTRLVGVFYGYLIELSNQRLIIQSHNAMTRVLNDGNVDIFFAPASYTFRKLDSTSGFLLPLDSLRLHGKLYFHEVDNTTHLANDNIYAQALQKYAHNRLDNLRQTVMYSRRETALAMMHGQGYWWFDMFAGWYDDAALMDELAAIRQATLRLWQGDMRSASEVAVFVDQESSYFIATESCVNQSLVKNQSEALIRAGLPWDCYVTDDLCHPDLPDAQYRLYLFLNLFKPSPAIRSRIAALRQAGKSLLFLYAPGYVTDDDLAVGPMQDLTGLPLTLKPSSDNGLITADLGQGPVVFGFPQPVAPLFTIPAAAEGCQVLGRYVDDDRPALVVRRRGQAFDAWCGAGPLPPAVLRELFRRAGVFVYAEGNDPLYVNRGLFGLYAHRGGKRTVRFPGAVCLQDIYNPASSLTAQDGIVELDYTDDEMKLYRIAVPE